MEYDRSRLKREVKLSMKGSGCMMVTLLFTVVVSAGAWLINLILGRLLTGGVGSISDTVWIYMQQGYEMEQALYIAMLELFRRGPGAIFGAAVGVWCCPFWYPCGRTPWMWAMRAGACPWSAMRIPPWVSCSAPCLSLGRCC